MVPARRENGNTKARMRLVEFGGLAFATASSPLLVLKLVNWLLVNIERGGEMVSGLWWR